MADEIVGAGSFRTEEQIHRNETISDHSRRTLSASVEPLSDTTQLRAAIHAEIPDHDRRTVKQQTIATTDLELSIRMSCFWRTRGVAEFRIPLEGLSSSLVFEQCAAGPARPARIGSTYCAPGLSGLNVSSGAGLSRDSTVV